MCNSDLCSLMCPGVYSGVFMCTQMCPGELKHTDVHTDEARCVVSCILMWLAQYFGVFRMAMLYSCVQVCNQLFTFICTSVYVYLCASRCNQVCLMLIMLLCCYINCIFTVYISICAA